MLRRIVAAVGITTLACLLAVQAADPPAPTKERESSPANLQDEARLKQEILARRFFEFEQQLLALAQRLERSTKQEDREKAQILKEAIKLANESAVDVRFGKLIDLLQKSKASNLQEVKEAIDQAELLTQHLRAILAVLLSDSREAQLKAEKERIQNILKELNKVIRDQKVVRAQTERSGMDPEQLAKNQQNVTEATKGIANAMAGKDGKSGDGKGEQARHGEVRGEGKSGPGSQGESKEDTRDPKGESRSADGQTKEGKEGQPGSEGKAGQGKEGQPGSEGKAGQGKEGQPGSEGKAGQGKEGQPGSEGKAGQGKEGQPGEGKAGEPKANDSKTPGASKGGDPKGGDGQAGEPKGGDPKGGDGQAGKGKAGDSKSGQGQGKGKGQGKGDAKGGQGDGQAKSGNQPSQGGGRGNQPSQGGGQGQAKGNDNSSGGGGGNQPQAQQPQQPQTPGRQQVEDAIDRQRQAEEEIRRKDNPSASDRQDDAIKKLEEARRQLEEILRQLREEELERTLEQLRARCEYMLQMQKEVYEGTVRVDRAIGEHADKKPTRPDEQKAQQLADREGLIVQEGTRALNLIEAEGSAVAFAEQFVQVIDDMKTVQKRLNKTDVGLFTQKIELDIIATLEEMIEALKKAQKDLQNQRQPNQPSGQPGQPGPQALLDMLAELKMIRAMQLRVNKRTEEYGKLYPGEQADDLDIQKELRSLSERQDKIKKIAEDIAKGRNQ